MITLVASVIKYNGDFSQIEKWAEKLPNKYPMWMFEKAEAGKYLIWTSENGLVVNA